MNDEVDDLYLLIRQAALTPSEQRVADVVLADYPKSALFTAQEVAATAEVSPASVSRFTAKLGYETFGDLREQLRKQLSRRLDSPGERLQIDGVSHPTSADLLVQAVEIDIENLRQTLNLVNSQVFTRLAERLADMDANVYIAASKKARVLADYLAGQLNQIRPSVTLLRMDDSLPDRVLDLDSKDILVAIEPRRATLTLVKLVEQAQAAGATVGVIADESLPSVLAQVDYPMPVPVRGPSAFDSYTAFMSVISALLAAVIAVDPTRAKARIDRLEDLNVRFDTWYDPDEAR